MKGFFLIRYLRLYVAFLRFSLSKAMEFRLDFFFRFFMDIFLYAISILFFQILFGHTSAIGGWTQEQVLIFVAAYLVVDGLVMTLFANNLWNIPFSINKGDLDYHLVRPVAPLFMLSLKDVAANSFLNLLTGLAFLAYTLLTYSQPLPLWRVLLFLGMILNGAFLVYLIRLLLILPVFWSQSSRGFDPLYFDLEPFAERPHGIYKGAIRRVLTTFVPFCLISAFPAELLFNGFDLRIFLHIAGITLLFFFATQVLWRAGLRSYSSASS